MINLLKTKSAFTLVEIILYTAVLSICLVAMSAFMDTVISAKAKNRIILEVERQGEYISSLIQKNIIESDYLNTPVSGNSSSLSLSFNDPLRSPTIFSLSNGKIIMTKAGNPAQELNTGSLIAENLIFENNSLLNTPGNISASFSLRFGNVNDRAEFAYQRDFKINASRRF